MITTEIDSGFVGLDLFHEPTFLLPNYLTQADNLYVDGGVLRVRPGIGGVLSEPLPNALREPTVYVTDEGAAAVLFVSGGKLYRYDIGSDSPVEIHTAGGASLALVDDGVRMCRVGKYVYIVDGAGKLIRTDLTAGETVDGFVAPTSPATAALTSSVIDSMDNAAAWSSDTLASPAANLFTNGDFSTGLSLYPTQYDTGEVAGGLSFSGPDVDFYHGGTHVPSGWAGTWALFDDAGEGFVTTDSMPVSAIAGDPDRFCRQFYVKFNYYQADPLSAATVRVELLAYSTTTGDDGDLIGAQSIEIAPKYEATQNEGQYADQLFTFPDLGDEIKSVRLGMYGGPTGKRGNGLCVTNVIVQCVPNGLSTTSSPGTSGLSIRHDELTDAYFGKIGGCRLRRDYGSAQDWSAYDNIAIDLGDAADLIANGLRIRLGFWNGAGEDHHYSNTGTFASDDSYVSFDISTVSIRNAFRYLEIVFTADTNVTALRSPFLVMGPISAAGSLSVGYADYAWQYTEVHDLGDGQVVESNPAPASAYLAPTGRLAQASVTLPAGPANTATNRYYIYRRGGTFKDANPRLVAEVDIGTDSADAAWAWNHATRTFTDNIPDSSLYQADTLVTSRDAPPDKGQAIAAWQGRLWIARGSELYASWLASASTTASLYFTSVNLPTSDTLEIEGATFSIGGDDGDPIQALVPIGTPIAAGNQFGGALLVFKHRSVWLVQGSSAADFSVRQYDYAEGVGLVAPHAVCRLDSSSVAFLGPDRIHTFPPNTDVDISLPIQPLLFGRGSEPGTVNSATLSTSWMTMHDRRLFVGVPLGDFAQPNAAFVFDLRQRGWTVWKPIEATGAVSLPALADGASDYALALAGSNGQLSLIDWTANADKATPDAESTPIEYSLTSRSYTQRDWSFNQSRAMRAHVDIDSHGVVVVTAASDSAMGDEHTYTFDGRQRVDFKLARRVCGLALTLQITGASTADTRVAAYGLAYAPARIDR
ncbi:MAG TPA: hypothetical protein VGK19_21285 [Capsulimonadaceae bacterium]|jgi:hypothetical protein